jgi:hypothetical protein
MEAMMEMLTLTAVAIRVLLLVALLGGGWEGRRVKGIGEDGAAAWRQNLPIPAGAAALACGAVRAAVIVVAVLAAIARAIGVALRK